MWRKQAVCKIARYQGNRLHPTAVIRDKSRGTDIPPTLLACSEEISSRSAMNIFRVVPLVALCLVHAAHSSSLAENPNLRAMTVSILSSQSWSDSTLSFPGTSGFNESTERWDVYQAPSFAVALAVGSEEDLVAAV
jgi:hypothetical protein